MSRRLSNPMALRILAAIATSSTRHHFALASPTLRAMLIAERSEAWVFKAELQPLKVAA